MNPIRSTLMTLVLAPLAAASMAQISAPAAGEHPLMGAGPIDRAAVSVPRAAVRKEARASAPATGEYPLMGISTTDSVVTSLSRAAVRQEARTQPPEAGDVTHAGEDATQSSTQPKPRLAQPRAKPLAGEQA